MRWGSTLLNILKGWDLDRDWGGGKGSIEDLYISPKPIFCALCRVVKPPVASLRPKGLGLGANLAEVQALAPSGPHRPPRPGEQEKDKEDQPQGLVAGGAVVVLSGPFRGLYGKVRNRDVPGAKTGSRKDWCEGQEGEELGLG